MTARELAEKIVTIAREPHNLESMAVIKIESLLQTALDECKDKQFWLNPLEVDRMLKEAKAEAYEDAAKIAENHGNCTDRGCFSREEDCGIAIAKAIRAKELK